MKQQHRSSALNSHFLGTNLSFAEYITQSREMIASARVDLNTEQRDVIINANSPKQHIPINKARCGILLIHGLFDSPHVLDSLFNHFSSKDHLVRSLLLPGHGTRPGDLLNVTLEEWQKATQYAIKSFKQEVEHLIVVGFSTGASLAVQAALNDADISGLILFAPADKIRNKFIVTSNWHNLISWFYERAKWLVLGEDVDYAKYQSIPFNSVYQVYRLTQQVDEALRRKKLTTPHFHILSSDDEVVNSEVSWQRFCESAEQESECIFYTNANTTLADSRIELRPSVYTDENILDFSHNCLPVSPKHPHYGKQGDFKDFHHYFTSWASKYRYLEKEDVHMGSLSASNLSRYHMRRLGFNPDFDYMVSKLDQFIQRISR